MVLLSRARPCALDLCSARGGRRFVFALRMACGARARGTPLYIFWRFPPLPLPAVGLSPFLPLSLSLFPAAFVVMCFAVSRRKLLSRSGLARLLRSCVMSCGLPPRVLRGFFGSLCGLPAPLGRLIVRSHPKAVKGLSRHKLAPWGRELFHVPLTASARSRAKGAPRRAERK